jgi:uncharacterized protein (TIGR02118 family)
MIVRLGMAPRARGLDYEGFQHHWRNEHGGLAGRIPGLRGYVQNHAVLGDGRPLLPYMGFDACSEIEFDSLESMDTGFGSDFYQSEVVADEQILIDKTRFGLLLCERRVLQDGDPGEGAVKLLTLLPVDPRSTREQLDEVIAGPYRKVVEESRPLRHEQLLEIPGAHEGRIPAPCAAVDILWFPDAGSALAHVNGDVGHRAAYELSGVAFGAPRVIAQPVRVV